MNDALIAQIKLDFDESEFGLVLSELESVTLEHVMASSQANLDNTRSSIVKLSKGSLTEVGRLVEAAKKDFRDVVYWASLDNEQRNT